MDEKLTATHEKDLRQAFSLFDPAGAGVITTKDLVTVLGCLGHYPTEAELRHIAKEVDTDGNGTVHYADFQKLVTRMLTSGNSADEIREAFRYFDEAGDGYISADELKHVMTSLGEKLSAEEVDEMIQDAGVLENGQITYEAFLGELSRK